MDSGGFFHVRFDEHRFPASGATQQKIAQTPERIPVEEYRILSGSARLIRAETYQECAQPIGLHSRRRPNGAVAQKCRSTQRLSDRHMMVSGGTVSHTPLSS